MSESSEQADSISQAEDNSNPPVSAISSEKLSFPNEEDKNGLGNPNYRYENDKYIYTDPLTKSEFEWNEEKKEWNPKGELQKTPDESYKIENGTYVYTDKVTGVKYKWDSVKNNWVADNDLNPVDNQKVTQDRKTEESSKKEKHEKSDDDDDEEDEDEEGNVKKKEIMRQDMSKGHYSFENDTHIFTDATDGTVYEWDKDKNAWFPRVNEEFLAQYQMSYGFVSPTETEAEQKSSEVKKPEPPPGDSLKRKAPQEPTWFEVEPENNTKVYVSNLPLDTTEQEFVDLMQKCGLVMKDIDSGKMKIKLYTEPGSNILKGDALCTYIKVESVELALKILDGSYFKGNIIKVERAKFTMKGGAYNPSLKPKKRKRKEKEKIKKLQAKLFDWHPEKLRGQRGKNEKVVIVKNLFDPSDFDKDVGLILEYQQDIREECSKCGNVRKVILYDKHPEGVVQITFKEPEAADACIQLLNNRWFGKRQITAETWDGKTKYKIAETEAELNQRLEKWDNFLKKNDKAENTEKDSDQDTRSSAGSQDETDDEDQQPATKKDQTA